MGHGRRRLQPCELCGEHIVKLMRSDRRILCAECSVQVTIDAARQMSAKSGPAWDKFLASRGPEGARAHRPKD